MAEVSSGQAPLQALDAEQRDRLAHWVEEHRPGFWTGPPRADVIGEGRSNLTCLVTDGRREAILRCPPPGSSGGSAHDVGREFRFLAALAPAGAPVPEPYLLCEEPDVIGRPFYLMERVPGRIFGRRADTLRLSPAEARGIAESLVDTLAQLHGVDPGAVGLADVGNPDGFTARHLDRWTQRLARWQTRQLPTVDRLARRLLVDVPLSGRAAVVHGDFRLGNVVVAAERPEVRAVLDWEMATVGDPLTDVGWLALSWVEEEGPDGVSEELGFPSLAEVLERYRSQTASEAPALDWYIAFACFKLAVIREGIRGRHQRGETLGSGFDEIGDRVNSVAEQGLQLLASAGR